ncbi:MAG TPA: efflux transporter outer membrane subunit, partial [Caulobacteraceae bacterium]|nr:efflux transporter outer membrane subunit [Caulobacteraceae bacterium]
PMAASPSFFRRLTVIALAGVVGGCAAVGPNFKPPAPPAARSYAGAGDKATPEAVLTADAGKTGPWWRALGSPALDAVMERALAHNQTVAAAQATLEKARAEAQRERAKLGPSVTFSAAYQRERINTTTFGFAGFPSPTLGLYTVGPTVSYDLDLAGGQRRRLEAARAQAQALAFRADAAYLTLTGNVALQAVRIAGLRAQIEAVQSVVADDRHSIEIVLKAEAAGGEPASAGLGGKLQLEQDLALLPPLEQELAEARHALGLLVGEAPSEWSPPDFAVDDFAVRAAIPVAIPSALVRQRPDIEAAEADLHADTALIGVESSRLYPDVRIVAGLTQEALTPDKLFGFNALAYYLGPSVSAPIFDGGEIRADRRAAQAQARADLARYRQTVITAFVQVSDVLSALAQDEDHLAALGRAEATARASLEEAREGYRIGGSPLANVVIADRRWRETILAKTQAIGQRLADIVALYGATAANWGAPRSVPNEGAAGRVSRANTVKSLAPDRQSP